MGPPLNLNPILSPVSRLGQELKLHSFNFLIGCPEHPGFRTIRSAFPVDDGTCTFDRLFLYLPLQCSLSKHSFPISLRKRGSGLGILFSSQVHVVFCPPTLLRRNEGSDQSPTRLPQCDSLLMMLFPIRRE